MADIWFLFESCPFSNLVTFFCPKFFLPLAALPTVNMEYEQKLLQGQFLMFLFLPAPATHAEQTLCVKPEQS